MTIFEQRLEALQDRLDRAIQANIEKYPNCTFDFSHKVPMFNAAFNNLRDAIFDYAENRITESQVKPHFIDWIKAIRSEAVCQQ